MGMTTTTTKIVKYKKAMVKNRVSFFRDGAVLNSRAPA
jgi:hypothetical protein